jgi:hypothetical protein
VTLEVLAQYAKAVGGHLKVTVVKGKDKVSLLPAARTAKATKPPAARAKVATRPAAKAGPHGSALPALAGAGPTVLTWDLVEGPNPTASAPGLGSLLLTGPGPISRPGARLGQRVGEDFVGDPL